MNLKDAAQKYKNNTSYLNTRLKELKITLNVNTEIWEDLIKHNKTFKII